MKWNFCPNILFSRFPHSQYWAIHNDKLNCGVKNQTWGFNSGSAPESTTHPLIFSTISDLDFRLSSMAPYLPKKSNCHTIKSNQSHVHNQWNIAIKSLTLTIQYCWKYERTRNSLYHDPGDHHHGTFHFRTPLSLTPVWTPGSSVPIPYRDQPPRFATVEQRRWRLGTLSTDTDRRTSSDASPPLQATREAPQWILAPFCHLHGSIHFPGHRNRHRIHPMQNENGERAIEIETEIEKTQGKRKRISCGRGVCHF